MNKEDARRELFDGDDCEDAADELVATLSEEALGRTLSSCAELKELRLASNEIEDDGARLLVEAQANSQYFRGFLQDIDVLTKALSIVHFDPAETILQEGEPGTWVGLLLSGSLEVIVGGKCLRVMQPGDFVGEMILWFGGVRQGTVRDGGDGGIVLERRRERQRGELALAREQHRVPEIEPAVMRETGPSDLREVEFGRLGSRVCLYARGASVRRTAAAGQGCGALRRRRRARRRRAQAHKAGSGPGGRRTTPEVGLSARPQLRRQRHR